MSLISVSIVNVALPSIQEGLGATQSDLQWILTGYALTFGVGLVTAGRAGDLYGRGGFFIIGVAIFTAASVWSALAPDPLWLNFSRAVAGVGSGLIGPQTVGMIQQYFRGAERGRAFGIFGSVVGVSVAIGPVLGGVLIQAGGPVDGWRWVFFVNVPVGVLAILLALAWMPRPLLSRPGAAPAVQGADGAPAGRRRTDLDPVGALLLGLALLAILLPFLQPAPPPLLWLALPGGLALVGLWLWWERRYEARGRSPMVELGIFRVPSFANGTLLMGLYFLGMTSIFVLVALYFQQGAGHTALATGLVGLPSAVLSTVSALWAGRAVAVHGRKVVVGGLVVALVGVALSMLVVWLHARGTASEWWLLLSLSFVGIAQGSVISPNQALTLAEVPLEYAGSSGGVMQTVQRVGTSMGIAVITAITFAVLRASDWSTAFVVGFASIGVVIAMALVVGVVDLRQRDGRVGL
ncbi:MFS transporter [Ornithinimicrobium avium]|uniref:MFS transporter n=2 Tax=Ornithinimicrobium avium TaxID=2283195 RepID=A0A345NS70_9MICO|nr:MFS transporter [Ornithinimicrobium avium]